MATTRIPAEVIRATIAAQQAFLEEEREHGDAVLRNIGEGQRRLELLKQQYEKSLERQKACNQVLVYWSDLTSGGQTQENTMESSAEAATFVGPQDEKTIIARMGVLRYRALNALREEGRLHLGELADITGSPTRRLKSSLASDVQRRVVVLENESYGLSEVGLGALRRFEEYRISHKIPLPSLVALPGEEEQDGEEGETPTGDETSIGGHDQDGYNTLEAEEQTDDGFA